MNDLVPNGHFVIKAKGPLIINDVAPDISGMTEGFLCLACMSTHVRSPIWVRSLAELQPDQVGIFHLSLLPNIRGMFEKHPLLMLTEPHFCPINVGAPLPEAALRELAS